MALESCEGGELFDQITRVSQFTILVGTFVVGSKKFNPIQFFFC